MTLISALIFLEIAWLLGYSGECLFENERINPWIRLVVLLASMASAGVSIGLSIVTLLRVAQ